MEKWRSSIQFSFSNTDADLKVKDCLIHRLLFYEWTDIIIATTLE